MKLKIFLSALFLSIAFILSAINLPSENVVKHSTADSVMTNGIHTQLAIKADNTKLVDTLSQIRLNTEVTANNTEKGGYDFWITVLLSALAFITSLITLCYTYRTYKSQIQTQENTIPRANKKIQRYLLNDLILSLFEGHIRLTALWYIMSETKYNYYPSEQILRKSKVSSDIIFTYLFYKDDKKSESKNNDDFNNYKVVQGFSEMLNDYNKSIDELDNCLKNKKTPTELIYREFNNILNRNDCIAKTWGKVMTILYNYNDEVKSMIFEQLLATISTRNEVNEKASKGRKYYKSREVYSDYLIQYSDKTRLLDLMEELTESYKSEFENYLIERN